MNNMQLDNAKEFSTKKLISVTIITIIVLATTQANCQYISPNNSTTVTYDDGDVHILNEQIYMPNTFEARGPLFEYVQTTINAVDGCDVLNVRANERGVVNALAGSKIENLTAVYDGFINTAPGCMIETLGVFDYSRAAIDGGTIGAIQAGSDAPCLGFGCPPGPKPHYSTITISGGVVTDRIMAYSNCQITVSGAFNYDYGQLPAGSPEYNGGGFGGGFGANTPSGRLTGTLKNGDLIDCDFYIFGDASITLTPVPEPTLLLLTLCGCGYLIRKRRVNLRN